MRLINFMCILLFCFININENNGYRILGIFPSNVRSHFVMFEKLMKGLIIKGHDVDIISYFPLKEKIKNYKHISVDELLPAKHNNVSFQSFIKPMRNIFWVSLVADDIGNKFCDIFKHQQVNDILNKSSHVPYDLVVTEVLYLKKKTVDFIFMNHR